MKIFSIITAATNAAVIVKRQARQFNGDYSYFNQPDDLSTTENFDEIFLLETTPQPFDIFPTTGPGFPDQTTGPDEIQLWTTGPDYSDQTTQIPFGDFTTESIFDQMQAVTTAPTEIDLSTIMTFPTDGPRLFTTGSIFGEFTTIPEFATLNIASTGLPPIPETTEFIPMETTPMMIDINTTPVQPLPTQTVPNWLFQTTANAFDFFTTAQFTGLPFVTTASEATDSIKEDGSPDPIRPNPIDLFDQLDAFSKGIEEFNNAVDNKPADQPADQPAPINENNVAVLIPVPNKSTTSSPITTSTSTTTRSSTTTSSTLTSSTSSSTTSTYSKTTSKSMSIEPETTVSSTVPTSISPTTSTSTTSTSAETTLSDVTQPSDVTLSSEVTNGSPDTSVLPDETTDSIEMNVNVTTPDSLVELTTGAVEITETPNESNGTTIITTTTTKPTTAGSGFTVTSLAITALLIILF